MTNKEKISTAPYPKIVRSIICCCCCFKGVKNNFEMVQTPTITRKRLLESPLKSDRQQIVDVLHTSKVACLSPSEEDYDYLSFQDDFDWSSVLDEVENNEPPFTPPTHVPNGKYYRMRVKNVQLMSSADRGQTKVIIITSSIYLFQSVPLIVQCP